MEFNEILNYLLGGGVLVLIVGVLTLKAKVVEANAKAKHAVAEAEKAKAEAESVRIDNAEHATRILIDNIVEPLRAELHETRKELQETKKEFGSTKREMARLRKAIADANSCKHADDCPVLDRLRDLPKGERIIDNYGGEGASGQHLARDSDDSDDNSPSIGGEIGDTEGQPP